MNEPEFQTVQREMAPRLASFSDQIIQNEALFRRIEAVYNSPDKAHLTPEQQRLVWLYYTNFVRAGARLGAPAKARLLRSPATGRTLHALQSERPRRRDRTVPRLEERGGAGGAALVCA